MGCVQTYEKYNLSKCTINNVPELSFEGQIMLCKVVEVYDGDTVTLCFKFLGKYFKKRCRLLGINAPEIRTKNLEEKEKGYNSKNYLYGILQDKIVTFDCKGYDKYGRLLGTIYLNGKNINDELLDKGFAVKYII